MIKHSDERPFVCDLCEYSAKTRGNLQRHLRSHTSIRPFSCNICNWATKTNSLLRQHANMSKLMKK